MPVTTHATFRSLFFRLFIVIAVSIASTVAIAVSWLDMSGQRSFAIEDVEQAISLSAAIAAADFTRNDWTHGDELFPLLLKAHHLSLLCIYDHGNKLLRHWSEEGYGWQCPQLVHEIGTFPGIKSVIIARAVSTGKDEQGLVYAETRLSGPEFIAWRFAEVLAALLSLAYLIAQLSAYYAAKHMNQLMDAIRAQIDCLMDHNTSECMLVPAQATRETLAMFDAIRSLRIHIESVNVPKETATKQRLWYENIFFNLFSLLRNRIPQNSVLIPLLADCELFLRLNNPDEAVPVSQVTDIASCVDEARSTARALNNPPADVHLVASFRSGPAREWMVQAGYLNAFLRHLLLIGLSRTSSGLVSLRLEVILQSSQMNRPILSWQLDDSGPPIQQGILHSFTVDQPHRIVSVAEASWVLAVQLSKRLKSTFKAENGPSGLLMRGEVPLGYPEFSGQTASLPRMQEKGDRRLVLVVGEPSAAIQSLCEMLGRFHCQAFQVTSDVQALEVAPALPFSVIIVAVTQSKNNNHAVLRRLLGLMDNKKMPVIPLWVVSNSESAGEIQAFYELGASEVLASPVKPGSLAQFCKGLVPSDAGFWAAIDPKLEQEFPAALVAKLPEMQKEFLSQIRTVYESLNPVPRMPAALSIIHDVHAVKSAALALGYMRIAVLMANLEHILAGRQVENAAGNLSLIADCLKGLQLT